jgi:DNA-binding NtrC family response regulator
VIPLSKLALIADDDPDVCWALDRLLRGLEVKCIRALDGQTALQVVRLNRLVLALLDAKLPDIDGLDLAQSIRIAQPDIPIVVISGYFYKDDPTIQAALDRELIQEFIEKPFSHTEVVQTVKHALREYRSKDRPQSIA